MVRKRRTSVPGEGHSSGELAGVERGAGGQLRPQGQQPFQQMPEHQGGYPSGGRSGYQSASGRIRPRGQEQLQQISEHQGGYQSGGRRGYQSGRRGGHTGGRGGRGPPAPQYPRGGATPQPGPSRPRSSDLHQATVLPYQSGRRGGHTGGRGGRGPPAPQYPRGGATPQPGPSRPRSSDLHQATVLPYQVAPNNSKLPFWRPTESLGDDSSSSHALQQHPIGEGLESWSGFHQSIRHTQTGISLNIDVSLNAFIEPLPVIEYVAQLLNKRDISSSQPLSDADHVKIKKALRGIKVEVTHRGEMRRKYHICGLTSQATWELTFPVDERGTLKSVVEYFHETYKSIIHYTWLPCLLVGNQQRPVYMPMEVCKIVPGQRYSKRLNKGQIAALLRETSQRPQERKTNINKIVDQIDYAKDEYAREFGTEISPVMVQVAARVLPAPQKVVNGGIVNHWICVNFASRVNDYTAFEFCQELAKICSNSGMTFQRKPVMLPVRANSNEVESVLKDSFQNAMTRLQGKELDLLIVILPDKNGSLNGDLKRICETDLGLVYQCCLAEQVLKDRQKQHQYLVNLSLKINVKVGGRNTVLADAPCIEGEGEEGHVFP